MAKVILSFLINKKKDVASIEVESISAEAAAKDAIKAAKLLKSKSSK